MLESAPPAQRERLKQEIDTNVAELDALVEEVLLASRLDALRDIERCESIDLLGLIAEEAARVGGASVEGRPTSVTGDERLLRRAVRNLIENALKYAGSAEVMVKASPRAVSAAFRGSGVARAKYTESSPAGGVRPDGVSFGSGET